MILGYARVSTDGQSVNAQVKQLHAAAAKKVCQEAAGDAKTGRRELFDHFAAERHHYSSALWSIMRTEGNS
jgi:DNA invertase Pin-like site-specific DNA recombinase